MDPEALLNQLGELGKQLDKATEELTRLDVVATGTSLDYARLKEEHEDAFADAFLHLDGPMEVRKMGARLASRQSRLEAERAHKEAEEAKSDLRTQQAVIKAIQNRIDVGRSLLSHEKSRMELDRLPESRRYA